MNVALVAASQIMYGKIKAHLRRKGSTAFLLGQLPSAVFYIDALEATTVNDDSAEIGVSLESNTMTEHGAMAAVTDEEWIEDERFQFLLQVGVLHADSIYSINVYAISSEAEATRCILQRLEALCSSFEPLPYEKVAQGDFNKEQLGALALSQLQPIVCVTRGPGVGKTKVIEGLVEMYAVL